MAEFGHSGGSDAFSQGLAQRARAGDQAALQQLYTLAGGNGPGSGAYRPQNRNAAIDAWNSLGVGTPLQEIENPHHGFLGALGSVLKVAAPIAGMAIPGLGPLAGAAIAAGGSALGGAMHGDKFDLGKTALAGLAGGVGQAANFSKLAGLGGGIPAGPSAAEVNGAAAASGMPAAAAAPSGGVLSKLGGLFKNPDGSVDAGKVLGTGAAAAGFIDARHQAGAAQKFQQQQLNLAQRQLGMAEGDYNARAPMRDAAYAKLAQMAQAPLGSSIYGRAA